MRITIDRDNAGVLDFALTIIRGLVFIGRLPDEVRRSSGGRGYHYVWHDACKDFEDCVRKRKLIGDDRNRIAHDEKKRKGFKQVLFTRKRIRRVRT